GLVHPEILVISFVRVHNSAQLAGDSRKTRRMLYPGSVALLHGTTYAVCGPVLLIIVRWLYAKFRLDRDKSDKSMKFGTQLAYTLLKDIRRGAQVKLLIFSFYSFSQLLKHIFLKACLVFSKL